MPSEYVTATPQTLEYRARIYESPRPLPWDKLRAVTAEIEAAWAGAEVTVVLAFAGDEPTAASAPLANGHRLEVFGNLATAREMIRVAAEHAPQALLGPQAQLLSELPEPENGDDQWQRGKLGDYAFGAEAARTLGRRELARGRLAAAAAHLGQALSRAPLDAGAWRLAALTRLLAGDGAGAEKALARLSGLGAHDTQAEYLHALSVYRQRRFAEASERLAGVARARSQDPAVRDLLACSLVQQWRIPEAMAELDRVQADRREGWKLMAQKCRMCAEGYREYQERMASDARFRWNQRWRRMGAQLGALLGMFYATVQLLFTRYPWVALIVLAALAAGVYLVERRVSARRGAQEQLADARGEAPNMPCWYASFVWGQKKPTAGLPPLLRRLMEEGETP